MKMQLGFKGGERERERERRERSNAARRARIVGPKKRREKKKRPQSKMLGVLPSISSKSLRWLA